MSTTPPAPPLAALQISVLGPVRAQRDGVDLVLGGLRQRSVLARLALTPGQTVPVDRLVDDLWSGEPPPSAVNTLQSYVSNLRRILGAPGNELIERSGAGYGLRAGAEVVVSERFEALVAVGAATTAATEARARVAALDEALALWHGDALADFADDEWARGDAVRLEELRVAAMETRFDLLLDLGQHAVVVGDLEAAVGAHPLRERFTAQLVLALYRCGRQAEALRAYERTRTHLADELGLDPGPDLVRLEAAVLDHDPALAAPQPSDAPAATAAPAPPSPAPAERRAAAPAESEGEGDRLPGGMPVLPLPPAVVERRTRSAFVGREAEQALLADRWAAVVAGDRRVVTIVGEPGAGKTRLVQTFARHVHPQGAHVLWGRCTPEGLGAYQPAVEAMRSALRSLPASAVKALVAPRPALGAMLPEYVPATEQLAATERYELFEALADLVDDVSRGAPVVFVVDDVQWADSATISLLEHLLRHERAGRLLIVATLRRPAGRATPELDRFLSDARRDGRHDAIDVGGLEVGAVAALLEAHGHPADQALAARVLDRTGGNPLFVEALADHGGDLSQTDPRNLPDSIREVLDLRLVNLDAEATQVLSAAAIVGLRVELGLLGAVLERRPIELLDVLDAAVATGLLAEDEELGWVTFPHALVRQALIGRLTRNREAALHLRVADVLDERPATSERTESRARHLLAAGRLCPPARAAAAAIDAGRSALGARAPEQARTWATRARDLLAGEADTDPEADRLRADAALLLGTAARQLSDVEAAAAAIDEVLAAARRRGDPLLLARAVQERSLQVAGVGFSYGEVDPELVQLLDEALAALPAEHHAERAALLAWSSMALTGDEASEARRMALSTEALAEAALVEDRADVRALATMARRFAVGSPEHLAERLELGPAMLADAVASGWIELEVVGHCQAVADLLEDDQVAEAWATVERLRDRIARLDRPDLQAYLLFLDAGRALVEGRIDEAEVLSNRALELGAATHGGNASQAWGAQQFMVARERGQLATFIPIVEAMVEQYPNMAIWRAGLAICHAVAGDEAASRATYGPLLHDGELVVPTESVLWYTTVAQLAELAWVYDDAELGTVVAPLLAPYAGRCAVSGMGALCVGHLGREWGLALAAAGDLDAAEVALREAYERAEVSGFAPWQARGMVERADVLERRGRSEDGEQIAVLRATARALAARLGNRLSLLPSGPV